MFPSEEFSDFAKSWNFNHTTSSPRYPKGNAHAEKAVGMVKQIYNHCEDPLFGMLILKTVPLLDVKESPDKIFFGWALYTNLLKPGMVHAEYENRYINQDTQGDVPSTRNFMVNDPVWIKLNEDLPWKKGVIIKVHDYQSYTVQVDGWIYHCNTHHLTRRYPRVDVYPRVDENPVESDREDYPVRDTSQRTLRPRHRVKMSIITLQATVHEEFLYK